MGKVFKILSFNVLAQTWIDSELRRHSIKKNHLERNVRIKKHIKLFQRLQPDIILLQEVSPLLLNKYQKFLPDYHVQKCFRALKWTPHTPSTPVNGNAIMWRHGTFDGNHVKCKGIALDKKRGIFAVLLLGKVKGEPLTVINVHLTWGNPGNASKEFGELFRQKHITHLDKQVIIGGDFNMGNKNFLIMDFIKKHGFVDHAPSLRTHPFPPHSGEDKTVTHILSRGFHHVKTIAMSSLHGKSSTSTDAATTGGNNNTIGECLRDFGSDHYPVLSVTRLLG